MDHLPDVLAITSVREGARIGLIADYFSTPSDRPRIAICRFVSC